MRRKDVPEISKEVGKMMNTIILQSNNTQKSTAKLFQYTRMTQSKLSLYCSGARKIPVEVIQEFCSLFQITPDILFGIKEIDTETINMDNLTTLLKSIDYVLTKENINMSSESRAELVSLLYKTNRFSVESIYSILDLLKETNKDLFKKAA